jgi:hypothetical protein
MTIGMILLILAVLIGGMTIVGQSLHKKSPTVHKNTTPSAVKTEDVHSAYQFKGRFQ